MQKELQPVQIPLSVNATKHFANNSILVYSTVEDDASKILKKFNFGEKEIEILAVNSENAKYIEDTDQNIVYVVDIIGHYLFITQFEHFQNKYELETCREVVAEVYCKYGIFFVKTVEETCDGEQDVRLYMVDLRSNKILQIQNRESLESYHMPYLLKCSGDLKILVEEASVFPCELKELNACEKLGFYSNKVLVVSCEHFIEAVEKHKEISWEQIISYDEEKGCYVQVLATQDNEVILTCTDENQKHTKAMWINVETKNLAKKVNFNCEITDVLQNNNVVVGYASWTDEILEVYDLEGDLVSGIYLDEFYRENDTLELNDIVALTNEKIIFDATDYGEVDERQIRVVYDLAEKKYQVYYAPFVMCGRECY